MKLDPEDFRREDDYWWRFWPTQRDAQIDIIAWPGEDADGFSCPSAEGLAALERALGELDQLRAMALAAVIRHRTDVHNWRLPPEDAWSLQTLRAHEGGALTLTFVEGLDTYGAWDAHLADGVVARVERRQV